MPDDPTSGAGSKKRLIFAGSGVLVLVLIVVAVVFFMHSKNDKNKVLTSETRNASPVEQKNQSASPVQTKADDRVLKDSERKSDINDLSSLLQSYADTKIKLPMLNEINNPSYRAENFPALDSSLLRDPDSKKSVLVAVPTRGAYSYEPTDRDGKACNNTHTSFKGPYICTKYKLTAILEDGTKYVKSGESPR
ncbi:MAG TPA: hypothetical protein VFW77_02275 [Candidatus Saccharimonadales bacterium]|nr:hypothetical protein [Candidatus Saccharimonadales bacterium]